NSHPSPGFRRMSGMDAKERHRRRQKLQKALARVLEVLLCNRDQDVEPDRLTGELASELVRWLTVFVFKAGLPTPMSAEKVDLNRFTYLLKLKAKETHARNRRHHKKGDRPS